MSLDEGSTLNISKQVKDNIKKTCLNMILNELEQAKKQLQSLAFNQNNDLIKQEEYKNRQLTNKEDLINFTPENRRDNYRLNHIQFLEFNEVGFQDPIKNYNQIFDFTEDDQESLRRHHKRKAEEENKKKEALRKKAEEIRKERERQDALKSMSDFSTINLKSENSFARTSGEKYFKKAMNASQNESRSTAVSQNKTAGKDSSGGRNISKTLNDLQPIEKINKNSNYKTNQISSNKKSSQISSINKSTDYGNSFNLPMINQSDISVNVKENKHSVNKSFDKSNYVGKRDSTYKAADLNLQSDGKVSKKPSKKVEMKHLNEESSLLQNKYSSDSKNLSQRTGKNSNSESVRENYNSNLNSLVPLESVEVVPKHLEKLFDAIDSYLKTEEDENVEHHKDWNKSLKTESSKERDKIEPVEPQCGPIDLARPMRFMKIDKRAFEKQNRQNPNYAKLMEEEHGISALEQKTLEKVQSLKMTNEKKKKADIITLGDCLIGVDKYEYISYGNSKKAKEEILGSNKKANKKSNWLKKK